MIELLKERILIDFEILKVIWIWVLLVLVPICLYFLYKDVKEGKQ